MSSTAEAKRAVFIQRRNDVWREHSVAAPMRRLPKPPQPDESKHYSYNIGVVGVVVVAMGHVTVVGVTAELE